MQKKTELLFDTLFTSPVALLNVPTLSPFKFRGTGKVKPFERSWELTKYLFSDYIYEWMQRDSNPQLLSLYTNTEPFSQFDEMVERSFTN